MGMSVIALAVFAVAIVLVVQGVRMVPQGFEHTVETFGRFSRVLRPGLGFIIPVVERIGRRMNMMETVLNVPRQDVITRDNAMVSCDAVVFIQVVDSARAAYEVNDLERAINNLSLTNIRTVVGSMDLDEVLSNRDEINSRLLRVIDAAANSWGVKVARIEIADLSPPDDITEAMARQMKAEREKRAEVLQAEGSKQSDILRAEGKKQAEILSAEGRREAAFRDAEAREREAEAEAKATAMVSEAISRGDVSAINYFLGQKYVEAFAQFAKSDQQRTLIVPTDFASVVSTLEGIKSLSDKARVSASSAVGSGATVPRTSVPPTTQVGGAGPAAG